MVELGNVNSVTDAGVGAQIAFTGVRGGIFNVLINLPQISDREFIEKMKTTCTSLEEEAGQLLNETMAKVREKIAGLGI